MAKKHVVIDCETDPFKAGRFPKPFIWGFYDGETFQIFEKTKDLIAMLECMDVVCYAHNGGKFDYHMDGFANKVDDFQRIKVINGRLSSFQIGECEFRDSYNIFPMPLSAFKKDEIDYGVMEGEVRAKHMPEIVKYLKGDCTYLWELIRDFRETYGDGLTLAGSALKFWRDMGNQPPKSSPGFFDALQPYYFGGRVEAFAPGIHERPFRVYDINSAYPTAMLREKHPMGTSYYLTTNSERVGPDLYLIEAKSLGALPYRDEKTKKLAFPADGALRQYHCTGWELIAGEETGTIIGARVLKHYEFHELKGFTTYVKHFYHLKNNSEKGTSAYLFAKLMMNSLYGKFGSNPNKYANYMVVSPELVEAAVEEEGGRLAGGIGDKMIIETDLLEAEKNFLNIATAASITGWVRAFLWRQICAVRAAGGEVLYCDTDSLAVTGGDETVPLGEELGHWDCEAHCVRGGIAGKKMYAFEMDNGKWKTGCKGARLSHSDIMRVCQGDTVTYASEAPTYSLANGAKFLSRDIKLTC